MCSKVLTTKMCTPFAAPFAAHLAQGLSQLHAPFAAHLAQGLSQLHAHLCSSMLHHAHTLLDIVAKAKGMIRALTSVPLSCCPSIACTWLLTVAVSIAKARKHSEGVKSDKSDESID